MGVASNTMDLVHVLIGNVRDKLISLGFSGEEVDEAEKSDRGRLIIRYLGVERRLIASRSRTIHKSSEFSCPPNHVHALTDIERVISTGGNLRPYLSKRIGQLNKADIMLTEWGVHHLHLGISSDQSGFIQRTCDLLFCYFTDDDVYFVDVYDHESFLVQSVIEVMHENWPDLLNSYRLPLVRSLYPRLSEDQSRKIRQQGCFANLTQTRDGTVYFPPGGGVTTSGDNLTDVRKANAMLNGLVNIQACMDDSIAKGNESRPEFRYIADATGLYRVEPQPATGRDQLIRID